MPQVPQYKREVGAQITPTPYRDDRVNGDTFGVNVYKAQQGLGEQVSRVVDGVMQSTLALKDKYDRTKLIEFHNELQKYEQDKIRNGYYKLTGKEAMGGSVKTMEDFNKNGENLINKFQFRGTKLAQAKELLTGYSLHLQKDVERYDYQQTELWNNSVYDKSYENCLNNATFYRHDPTGLQRSFKNLDTLIENDQRYQKLDSDMKTVYKANLASKMHENVLNSLIAENSLAAKAYYEQNKDKISAARQADYLDKITRMNTIYSARDNAQKLSVLEPLEAYKQIDTIENIELRNATESEYNRLLRQKEIAQKEQDNKASNEIMQEVYSAFESGRDVSEIMRKINIMPMSLEQKESLYKNIKTMQELEGIGNNWADYNILLDMATYNNEEFKNVNFANYNLTKEQYNKMTEMQRKAVENKYSPEIALRKEAERLFPGADIARKEQIDEAVRYLAKIERMQGTAFDLKNKEQMNAIMAGFQYKEENATNKNFDEVYEIFERAKKKGEVYDLMAREYQLYKAQNKKEPEPKDFYDMAVRSYNTVNNEWKRKDQGRYESLVGLRREVGNTTPLKGETKALTYFADVAVPEISSELGFNLRITSRFREGDKGGHGQGRKIDIGTNGLNENQRIRAFEKMLAHPLVGSIGTSDPILLKRFNNPANPKIRDLRKYDIEYRKRNPNTTMNHINHFDISLDTRYDSGMPNYNMTMANNQQYMTQRID